MNTYYFIVSIGHKIWKWLSLVILAQALLGCYRPDEREGYNLLKA